VTTNHIFKKKKNGKREVKFLREGLSCMEERKREDAGSGSTSMD